MNPDFTESEPHPEPPLEARGEKECEHKRLKSAATDGGAFRLRRHACPGRVGALGAGSRLAHVPQPQACRTFRSTPPPEACVPRAVGRWGLGVGGLGQLEQLGWDSSAHPPTTGTHHPNT